MYVIKNCPQCGIGEGVYTEYPLFDDFGLLVCFCCGFQVKNYFNPKADDERNPVPEPGFGVKQVVYDTTLGLGSGKSENLTIDTDYEKELALYDRLVSMGVIVQEKSYMTRAEGSKVIFLRGDIQNIKNYFHDDYNTWISKANSKGEISYDLYNY